MSKFIVISLISAIFFPGFVLVLSFITWKNGFRMFGAAYIFRMTVTIEIMVWLFIAISTRGTL